MPVYTTGLGSQLGVATETTYGTAVTTNRWFEFRGEGINLQNQYLQSQQLRAGRMFTNSTRRVITVRDAAGTFDIEVPNQSFGVLLNQLHGNTVTPVQQGATTAYLQTHDIGTTDSTAKSLTVQVGRPTTAGVVTPYTYSGGKVTGLTFACTINEWLTANLQMDFKDEAVTTPTLATAAYPTALRGFTFVGGTLTLGGTAVAQVRAATVPLTQSMDTGRWYFGTNRKATPLLNAYQSANATMDVDYLDQTLYAQYLSGTPATLVLDFVGNVISGAYSEELKITIDQAQVVGDTPNASGPGILTQSVPFVALDGGTNPPVRITYQSVDVSL